jgi:hypothetical protein
MTPEEAEIRLNIAINRMQELQKHRRRDATNASLPLATSYIEPTYPRWLARIFGRTPPR